MTGIAPARPLPPRDGPLVPAHEHLPAAHRVRERAGGVRLASPARLEPPHAGRAPLSRRDRGALAAVGLLDRAGEVSAFLSHGAQKQLELGIALALEPELLLLDEPTAGMSVTETRESIALIERLARERDLTLLFTEHDMEVVFGIARRITVLHQGRVIADGAPDDVRRDPDVRRVYLGESAMSAEPCSRSRTCTPPTASRRCCSASRFDGGAPASAWRCSGATASARPRPCAASWDSRRPRAAACCGAGTRHPRPGAAPRSRGAGIGFVPEDRRIFAELTVWENLDVAARGARRRRLDGGARLRALSEAPRAARPPGRIPLRRRAADADDRAHADGEPGAPAARRAVGGAGAARRRAPEGADRAAEGARG